MIEYQRHLLSNGLTILIHKDTSSPLVAMNILYKVGARDESPKKTGFAHLFEHLMFGGSLNIPKFDEPLERVGGENNAFTNNDYTNYYLSLPANNLETAFWLESDRMNMLAFSEKSLDVQRSVVVEEFRQRYLNQPYGDAWLLLRPLAYKVHPYRWSTIGMEVSHIQNAVMNDVRDFYNRFYNPDNAILVLSGNLDELHTLELCNKWFEPIRKKSPARPVLPAEPLQLAERRLTVEREVPYDAIYKAWHICKRTETEIIHFDIISDILSSGKSSRFHQHLIHEKQLFTDVDAYITGDMDEGLFVVSGKLNKGVRPEDAEDAVFEEISKLQHHLVPDKELQKIINRAESALRFGRTGILEKAMELAFYEYMGDASLINHEFEKYKNTKPEDILSSAYKSLRPENCSSLIYSAKK